MDAAERATLRWTSMQDAHAHVNTLSGLNVLMYATGEARTYSGWALNPQTPLRSVSPVSHVRAAAAGSTERREERGGGGVGGGGTNTQQVSIEVELRAEHLASQNHRVASFARRGKREKSAKLQRKEWNTSSFALLWMLM